MNQRVLKGEYCYYLHWHDKRVKSYPRSQNWHLGRGFETTQSSFRVYAVNKNICCLQTDWSYLCINSQFSTYFQKMYLAASWHQAHNVCWSALLFLVKMRKADSLKITSTEVFFIAWPLQNNNEDFPKYTKIQNYWLLSQRR